MSAPPPFSEARRQAARARARAELLARRTPAGHWVGELSSSALSTATAVMALTLAERAGAVRLSSPILPRGLDWLAQSANADGGWGDTTRNLSNISTTALVWAAFGTVPGADGRYAPVVNRAEQWLGQHIGITSGTLRTQPEALALAILERYGQDRTFSVPILTACALAGRLGSGRAAWEKVIPLPFELAACPHQWFAALRLPVVSYALPALIAIGLARHVHRPTRNPILRLIRHLARPRTLRILDRIQPEGGGFLEATPLTSFVVMSLAGSGQAELTVVRRGVEFLVRSQRPDGSWPIDSNLATWVTTLAVNALATGTDSAESASGSLNAEAGQRLQGWLLSQQYKREHPYTHAAPGGWAWTDLPGGVPDADDTAGALLALWHLRAPGTLPSSVAPSVATAAGAGTRWLLALQNRDGGIPTFCRGWGALPFDRSGADLTAHALRAWLAWLPLLPPQDQPRTKTAIGRGLAYLSRVQRTDGSWLPLWFGNQHAPHDENPLYGTARVVRALVEALPNYPEVDCPLSRGVTWLLHAQGADGGWGGVAGVRASVEETAVAVETLARVLEMNGAGQQTAACQTAVSRGTDWLVTRVESGDWTCSSPIGFYFAKLWYHEQLYPQIFTVAALDQASRLRRGTALT